MSAVYDVLRKFEQRAPSIDIKTIDYSITHDADYWRVAQWQRDGRLGSANLYAMLLEEGVAVSEVLAKGVVKEAVLAEELLRVGAGSATGYRTVEYQEEVDQAARDLSVQQQALGVRAGALGLPVDYETDSGYQTLEEHELAEWLAKGHLITKASLRMSLEELVTYLEDEGFVRGGAKAAN